MIYTWHLKLKLYRYGNNFDIGSGSYGYRWFIVIYEVGR